MITCPVLYLPEDAFMSPSLLNAASAACEIPGFSSLRLFSLFCSELCPCSALQFPQHVAGHGLIFIYNLCSCKVYIFFKRGIHVLYQFWKILSRISSNISLHFLNSL